MATVADGKTKSKTEPRCFARRHMSMAAATFHSYAFGVSRTSGVFFSDDRRDAEEFNVWSHTIFNLRTWLERHGWLVAIDKGSKRKRNPVTGHWLSIRYRVLAHDEWAATHRGHCRFPEPKSEPISPDAKSTAGPDVKSTSGPDVKSTAGEQSPDVNLFSTGCEIAISPDVNFTAKVVEASLKREFENTPRNRSLRSLARELQTDFDPAEPTIDRSQSVRLRQHAESHGWTKADLKAYLLEYFSVDSPMRLTLTEFRAAYKRTQNPPPQTGKGKRSNVEAIR